MLEQLPAAGEEDFWCPGGRQERGMLKHTESGQFDQAS